MDLNLLMHAFEIVAIIFLMTRDVQFTDVAKAQMELNAIIPKYMKQVESTFAEQSKANAIQDQINKATTAWFKLQEQKGEIVQ